MTTQQEQELFKTLRSLKKEIGELKDMLVPYKPKKDEFLTTKEALRILKISERKLHNMLSNDELPFATKAGHRWRFSKNGIEAYLSKTLSL